MGLECVPSMCMSVESTVLWCCGACFHWSAGLLALWAILHARPGAPNRAHSCCWRRESSPALLKRCIAAHSAPPCSLWRRPRVPVAGDPLSGGRSDHRRRRLSCPANAAAGLGLGPAEERSAAACGAEEPRPSGLAVRLTVEPSTALAESSRSSSTRSPMLAIGLCAAGLVP